jgi:hypothetical protein
MKAIMALAPTTLIAGVSRRLFSIPVLNPERVDYGAQERMTATQNNKS